MDSVNFVHDVNTLRKTIKSVYSISGDLRALNEELDKSGPGNCRVQVLPVVWRHLLDFPKRRQKKGEHDLGDALKEEDDCKRLTIPPVEAETFFWKLQLTAFRPVSLRHNHRRHGVR